MSYTAPTDINVDPPTVQRDVRDAVGRTYGVGDRIAFAVSRGSSSSLQIAEVVKVKDSNERKLDRSIRRGDGSWVRYWTYRKSYTLRVRYLSFDSDKGEWGYGRRWDSNRSEYVPVEDPSDAKLNTIRKVENVVRIEL